jgi:hypothetical protein
MMLLALRREGIAGVWGVCGDIGFPGEDDVDMDVPATIGGTLDNCRLDELDERWSINDDDMESERAALESLIRWNRFKAADVLLVLASAPEESPECWKLFRSFFKSSIFRNSPIFSSSSWIEPELPPPASASTPEPGCADDAALPFPLLLLSSSTLLPPPDDSLALLLLKLLLYLEEIGAGLGELEADDVTAFSGRIEIPFGGTNPVEGVGGTRVASVNWLNAEARATEVRGDIWIGVSLRDGEAERDGALNGWKDTEGLLWTANPPSFERTEALEPWIDRRLGAPLGESEGDWGPCWARRADRGLEPVVGPTWWNVDKLP